MDLILEFAAFWAAAYVIGATIMFAVCLGLIQINKRHPERKIQKRPQTHDARKDIISSLKQIAVTAFCLSVGLFSQWKGWTITPVELSWWSFPLFFVISLVLHDAWFYFGHRLLHWQPMYRFHALHHKSVAPTVWSNDSSGVVDTFIEHSFYLVIWFILPVPALAIFALRLFDQISGMIGHSGFEFFASPTARRPWPFICTTFHDLHHSKFNYNYGNIFSIWDRMLGTAHPQYDDMVKEFEEKAAR